jgi:hypothetical protein
VALTAGGLEYTVAQHQADLRGPVTTHIEAQP